MAGEDRKTKYHTHVFPKLLLIEAWARDGITDEQIAEKLGVAYSTFRLYKDEHSALSAALKKGKEVADVLVENALFKRALGYQYVEVTSESRMVMDQETGQEHPVMMETKRVLKEVQPDTTAQIFWLKNRRPKQWRDKQDIEHSGSMKTEVQHDLKKLSPKELEQLEHIIAKSADSG